MEAITNRFSIKRLLTKTLLDWRIVFSQITIAGSAITGVGLYLTPTPAYAIYCANCSTFYQQMFEYVEAVNTALNTAEQLNTQTQQYKNMVEQGASLPNSMVVSVAADLKNIVGLYSRSQALGRQIQNMDAQFGTTFPNFESYLNQAGNSAEIPARDRYQKWSDQSRDNLKVALEAANLNTSSFESEDSQLESLVVRSQTAVGRMQAIQSGNEIAAQNVQQLQKLRDLLATQVNMQGNYMAQRADRQTVNDAAEQKFKEQPTVRGGSKGY